MSRFFSIFLVVTLHFSLAWAQTTTGSISGTVTDETGGVLPGVDIVLTNTDTGASRTVISDDEGRYRSPNLTLGHYEVEAALAGFQTSVRSGIQLTVGREAVVDIRLSIGEISERVVVEGEAALVETTSPTLTQLVDERQIVDLPLNGRSFTQLALLQAGVGYLKAGPQSQTGNTGEKISVSGTRLTETSFLLDGVDIRGHRQGTPTNEAGVLLGVDTTREFSVVSGIAGAEYGGFTGGVINIVSKSGTNQFHGTLFEFHRNKSLQGANFFDNKNQLNKCQEGSTDCRGPFVRNQFGFTAGGPIVSDRTFIFGSYEGLRDRTSTGVTSRVPTADARNGILFGPVDPAVVPYLEAFPLPNGAAFSDRSGNPDGTARFNFTDSRPTNVDYFMTRFDHQFSDSDSIYVRYTLSDSDTNVVEQLPTWRVNRISRNQYSGIGWTKVLSTSLVNEFRVGYNRTHANSTDEEATPVDSALKFNPNYLSQGNISLQSRGLSQWGPSRFRGLDIVLNRFEYADTLSYNVGRHSLKFGGQVIRLQFNNFSQINSRGNYVFLNLENFLTNDSFRLTFTGQTTPPFTMGIRETLFAFFVQDNYQVRPNLTLNFGLRYEPHTNPTEVAGRTSNLDHFSDSAFREGGGILGRNPSKKNFAPRLGFAWDITGNGKTSLRGGYGIFYDLFDSTTWVGAMQQTAPFFVFVTYPNTENPGLGGFPNPFGPSGPDPTLPARPNMWVYETPSQGYVQQWSLTLQQEVLPLTVVTASYNGSRGVKLLRSVNYNSRIPTIVDGRITFDENDPQRNPNFLRIDGFTSNANSYYHGLRLGVNRRFSQGFQVQANYTWSHAIDDASNAGSFDGPGGSTDNLIDFPDVARANSNMDLRNLFQANFTYALPGPSPQSTAGKFLGGWLVSGILNLTDGSPYNNLMTIDHANTGLPQAWAQRPDLVPGGNNNPIKGDGRDPDEYFDRSGGDFVLQDEGVWGNLGRNTLRLGGTATFDLSLQKDTPIAGERVKLQFRAEFFNLLNRANWGAPTRVSYASSFGTRNLCPGGICADTPYASSFGAVDTTSTSARQVQLALKLIF